MILQLLQLSPLPAGLFGDAVETTLALSCVAQDGTSHLLASQDAQGPLPRKVGLGGSVGDKTLTLSLSRDKLNRAAIGQSPSHNRDCRFVATLESSYPEDVESMRKWETKEVAVRMSGASFSTLLLRVSY